MHGRGGGGGGGGYDPKGALHPVFKDAASGPMRTRFDVACSQVC